MRDYFEGRVHVLTLAPHLFICIAACCFVPFSLSDCFATKNASEASKIGKSFCTLKKAEICDVY